MSEINEINERVKQVRQHFGYNQKTFGEMLGLSVGGLSGIEIGRRAVNDRHILALKGMGVSEKWIRTGEGSMFDVDNDDALEKALRLEALQPEAGDLEFIRHYLKMDVDKRRAIRGMCGLA